MLRDLSRPQRRIAGIQGVLNPLARFLATSCRAARSGILTIQRGAKLYARPATKLRKVQLNFYQLFLGAHTALRARSLCEPQGEVVKSSVFSCSPHEKTDRSTRPDRSFLSQSNKQTRQEINDDANETRRGKHRPKQPRRQLIPR